MKIIGITGRARSGKDTLASLILAGTTGERMSFAEPIRAFVAKLAGLSVEDLTDGPLKEQPLPAFGGKSPRQMMQTLGTEWGRELVDQNLWITYARNRLTQLASYPESARPAVVVFSDVRFENEAAMIRDLGGSIVHISRPEATAVSEHTSEAGIAGQAGDYHCKNIGSVDDLATFARCLLQN